MQGILEARTGLPAQARRLVSWCGWLGLWLVLATPLAALDSTRNADSYSIQGWFTEHGLPSNKIRAFAQTRDGYLWIATAQGIARFDGLSFTVLSRRSHPELRGGGFFAVLEAPDGALWFGGDQGIFRWRTNQFEHYTVRDGLADNYVRGLALTRDGGLVACTFAGFSFVRDGRITTPRGVWSQITGVARSYLERADGSILLGTSEGLWRISGETIERFPGLEPTAGGAFDSLLETPDGSLWIGYSRGVHRVYPDGRTRDYGTAEGLADCRIASLQTDGDGNVWIGTYGGGLYRLADDRIEAATYPKQFGVTPIRQILEDREGGLWIATATGLFRLKDTVCSDIGLAQGLTQTSVYAVFESQDGAWWIGLWGGGVFRYDPHRTRAEPLAMPKDLGLDQVLAFAEEPAGTLWIGAVSGLYCSADGVVTNRYQPEQAAAWLKQFEDLPGRPLPGLAHRRVNSIAPDGAGELWIATDGALYHGREGNYRAWSRADGLPGNNFKSVLRARNGDVWATAPPEGVACFHQGRWTNYLCGQGISDVYPRAVYEDRAGAIWVTTEGGGLNRFKEGRWRVFTTGDGLADDFISGLVEDDEANLWIAFPGGIMRIPGEQFDQLDAGRRAVVQPRIFNRFDGLPAAECNHAGSPGAWRTQDGQLLFATDRGVAVIEPARVKSSELAPPLYLERLVVNGADADLSRPVIVPPGANDVQIHYTAVSLLAAEKVRFKLRLEPLDRVWLDTGGRRDIRYARLPPGNYSFRVMACNSDGVWNQQGFSLAVTVRPFLYQTAWFRGLLAVGVVGAAFGLYRVRLRRARREMTKLEAQVNARTRELRLAKDKAEEAVIALKKAETEREDLHRQLLEVSRQAGMAEVATGVLHNVGNVLNSANVSAGVLADQIQNSGVVHVERLAALLVQHAGELGEFLARDPRGQRLPAFLTELAALLKHEQTRAQEELAGLHQNLDHIKQIVSMQQNYARVAAVTEPVKAAELVDDALRMCESDRLNSRVQLTCEYAPDLPVIITDRHKVLQIVINLLHNANHACVDSGSADRRILVRVAGEDGGIRISVTDNGIGIPPENLTRIFHHGFTTRKDGHGFGLHNGALTARELGGELLAQSDGPGRGATFTLVLPAQPAE